MIYTGLGRLGEIADVKAHGGADVAEVYGGINEANPIYYKTRTITGQTPLSYKALGKSLSDYLVSGNTLQNGTPAPEAPVDVVGCGVRTAQLFEDKIASCSIDAGGRLISNPDFDMYLAKVEQGETYIASANITGGFFATKPVIGSTSYNGQRMTYASQTITAPITGYMTFRVNSGGAAPMFNLGSTAMPYEPYGYKLPLTVNGTEYPIYLGQVPTTRRIKKRMLTGREDWDESPSWEKTNTVVYYFFSYDMLKTGGTDAIVILSDSFSAASRNELNNADVDCIARTGDGALTIRISKSIAPTKSDFTAWLSEHAPTIWYVLATPETGIVNEPLHKIGDYADTVSMTQSGITIPTTSGENTLLVDTTVQPSSVSITGNIKEVST